MSKYLKKISRKCLETYTVIWSDNFVLGEQNKRMMRWSIRPQISLSLTMLLILFRHTPMAAG